MSLTRESAETDCTEVNTFICTASQSTHHSLTTSSMGKNSILQTKTTTNHPEETMDQLECSDRMDQVGVSLDSEVETLTLEDDRTSESNLNKERSRELSNNQENLNKETFSAPTDNAEQHRTRRTSSLSSSTQINAMEARARLYANPGDEPMIITTLSPEKTQEQKRKYFAESDAAAIGTPLPEVRAVAQAKAAHAILHRTRSNEKRIKAEQKKRDAHDKAMQKLREKWLPIIKTYEVSQTLPLTKHLHKLCFAGVPGPFRSKVWPVLIDNKMQITDELFSIFREKARVAREQVEEQQDLEARRTMYAMQNQSAESENGVDTKENSSNLNDTSAVITSREKQVSMDQSGPNRRNSNSSTFDQDKSNPITTLTDEADTGSTITNTSSVPSSIPLLGRENSVSLIKADLQRTFPHLAFFRHDGPLYEPLRDVLEAYVCYRPDVGYVQGMSYLAAMLLLNLSGPADSFRCFANLLANSTYFDFYRLDMERMRQHLDAFRAFFESQLPVLYTYFEQVDLDIQSTLIDWILTLFTRVLPLDVACRVWDAYFVEGEHFVWRVALAILRYLEPELLQTEDFGTMIRLLQRIHEDQLDADTLFHHISSVTVPKDAFEKYVMQLRQGQTIVSPKPHSHGFRHAYLVPATASAAAARAGILTNISAKRYVLQASSHSSASNGVHMSKAMGDTQKPHEIHTAKSSPVSNFDPSSSPEHVSRMNASTHVLDASETNQNGIEKQQGSSKFRSFKKKLKATFGVST